jgi:DNA polymerase (family 10)
LKNVHVAKILNEIAGILEMRGVEFKPRAYRKAARTVESLSKPIEEIYEKGNLQDLSGIGESIAEKIAEIIETGSSSYYENLKEEMPVDVDELTAIEGIGPKTVEKLYKELGIKTLEDLEQAARQQKIRAIEGLGLTTEENILDHIELAKRRKERTLLGYALPIAEEIKSRLTSRLDIIDHIEMAGSARRMKPTIGDVDLLVTSRQPDKVAEFFTSMENVREVLGKGKSKCSIILENDMQVDLRLIQKESYGSALLYFTGSKDHNIELRKVAINNGYKLNEYGLFREEERVAGTAEDEVYDKLGMQWIPPELRENRGEIEAALQHALPSLIGYDDIRGDLQVHTKWSDGSHTIAEMAKTAIELGYSYICISDHYSRMVIAGGLTEKQLRKQWKEIDEVNSNLTDIEILKGAEVDIAADGRVAADKTVLEELDIVVASVHSKLDQPKAEMTRRLVKAMENDYVNIIGHPTGRKIHQKEGSQIDLETLFETSKTTETFLEINSFPNRLDLDDLNAKAAAEAGCRLVINTDAHNREHLLYMRLGIAMARRGWLKRQDVINTMSLRNLMELFKH